MCEANKLGKKMKKGIRKIINTMPFPANMDAVQTFLSGYSDQVEEIDCYSSIGTEGMEREINVKFFNEDMLSVFADNKTENMERYIINLDGAEDRSFYYTKDGSQPWIG